MRAITDRDQYVEGLSAFVQASPSSYHAAHEAQRILMEAGFTRLKEDKAWPKVTAGSRSVVVRDGAVIAWVVGESVTPAASFRILGAHTDSPGFKLKPSPAFTTEGWAQAAVEVYGGPLLNSWLDRDIEFSGRLVTRDGAEHLARTGPLGRIPQLAIHLDRQVNDGLKLARQQHTQPVIGIDLHEDAADVLWALANSVGVGKDDVLGADVVVTDTQAPARIGADEMLFASGRLDNLSSTYAGLMAMTQATPSAGTIAVVASFDHEEIGSESRSGACGPFLEEVLSRIQSSLGAGVEDRSRSFARSWCLSADAGHSVHPNYRERHDPNVRPLAGRGPMLKVNAQQRYASDAHGEALWRTLCERAGVNTQVFVSNNDIPCGSTIGPLTATRLGIRTVDVGVPLLSMHSARELAHVRDLHGLALVVREFFQ